MCKSSQTPSVTITAKRARHHGYRSIFRTGAVLAVNPHRGQPIMIQSVQDFRSGQVVIKDHKGKRRTVPLSTIKSLEVEALVAEKIKDLPEENISVA